MELRKGKYYIVRYCNDNGCREYYNQERDEFKLCLRDATAYDTKFMAMPHHAKFNDDAHYSYSIQFHDN